MKQRTDYVTNSSSTSYCIVGVPEEMLAPKGDDMSMDCENNKVAYGNIGYEPGYGNAGLDIGAMEENETLKGFKQKVLDLLLKAFPDSKIKFSDIQIHVDGGYDG